MNGTIVVDRPSPRRRLREHLAEFASIVVLLTAGALVGRQCSAPDSSAFPRGTGSVVESTSAVQQALGRVGLDCAAPLVFTSSDGDAGQNASCTDGPRFDLAVTDSTEQAYLGIELARRVGCYGSVGMPAPRQWFTATRRNWVLFTLDADVATAAARLPGVMVSTAHCERPTSSRVE